MHSHFASVDLGGCFVDFQYGFTRVGRPPRGPGIRCPVSALLVDAKLKRNGAHVPPLSVSGPCRTFDKGFLQRIGHLPPPTGFFIFTNGGHIFLEILRRASVLHCRDEDAHRRVVVDGVVGDVTPLERREDRWPGGCVKRLILLDCLGPELRAARVVSPR